MPTTIEQTAPCRKKLRVEVDPPRVAAVRAELLQEFQKAARIPGFRPGKAPRPMVERRYAKELDEELRKKLIPDTYREALKEHQLKVVGYPQIESVEHQPGQAFVYLAAVETAPDFALPNYQGLAVNKPAVAVTDAQVEETIDLLRDQQADFVVVERREVQRGDFAVIDYQASIAGQPVGEGELPTEARTLRENKNFWVRVEPDGFLPGFCDQLIGAKQGEERQIKVDFPADFSQSALAGKQAVYAVTVQEIREKRLPDLDAAFAQKAGAETLDKLQAGIREGLQRQQENAANGEARKQIIDQLLAATEFELPESLVQQETRSIVYDLVRENSQRGATKEQLEEKKDEIYGFASKNARDRLRASFILDAIARAEGIKVEAAELERRIAEMAQRYRQSPERLKAQLAEKDGLGEVEEQVLVSKTLDFLIANAKVTVVAAAK